MSFGGTELFDVFANGDTNGDGIKRKNDEPMQIDANVKKTKQEEEDDENELKTLMESLPQGKCSSNLCYLCHLTLFFFTNYCVKVLLFFISLKNDSNWILL